MPGPNSQAMYEANLGGSFSDHPRSNKWADEVGAAATWEKPTMESHSMDNPRGSAPTTSPAWNSTTIENTGVTKGNGLYSSDLPNH